MSTVNNVPRDIQESIRELLGRRVKLYIKRMVKQELRPDKWENRVLTFSGCRVHIFQARAPSRQETSLKYLDIQTIESKKTNQLTLVVDGKSYNFVTLEADTDEINHMITHIGISLKQLFPAFPLERIVKTIEVHPADRLKPMFDMIKQIESKEHGPCGGFTMMYACMCDYHNVPYREEVDWDVNTIYSSQDSRELRLQDFDHLNQRDLVPIIAALEHNPWFTKLNVDNVKLTPEAQNEVLKVMMRNAVIEELSLCNTGINGEFVQKLATALLSNTGTQLTKIDISNNLLEDKAIIFFIGSLGNLTKGLVHFDISRTKITSKAINKVAETFGQNRVVSNTLKVWKVADNSTRGEELSQLNQFLAQPNAITHLDLSGTECALENLCGALLRGCCPSLTHLSLARNVYTYKKIKDVVVPSAWKNFFATVVGLEYLDLSCCKIPSEALKELLLGIGSNKHIKSLHLDLSSNDLQTQGAVHLESCIANISNVISLDISNNGLDQGLVSMLDWIQKNNTLKHLSIGRNFDHVKPKLMSQVLDSVVKLIQDEDLSLESLSLADSKLKKDTAVVVNALGSNVTLTHLDLSGNQMGDFGARMLSKALQINSKLRSIMWDKNLTTVQGFEDIANALNKNYTLRKMPTPVNDAAQALLKQPERTETALQKIEVLLQRNHSPQKYSSDQAYRLQQGFLISSTQQMVDRLVVQVQDTTNALSIGSTEGFQSDIDHANSVVKDADNSKQLLSTLQDIAIKSVSEDSPVEQQLRQITTDLMEVIQSQMKKTVSQMVESTKAQCTSVMKDESMLSELESSCAEKSALPKDFTKNVLEGVETEIINKLNELNLAVATHISDKVIDSVLDNLSTSHKTLTNHLNIKKSKQKHDSVPPSPSPSVKPTVVIEEHLESEKKKKTDAEENEKPKDTNLLQPEVSPVSSPWMSYFLHPESSTPNVRDQRKSKRIRPPTVIDSEHVQKALQLHSEKTSDTVSPTNSPAAEKTEPHPQSQPMPKPRVRHSKLLDQQRVSIKIDDCSTSEVTTPVKVTCDKKTVDSHEDLSTLMEDQEAVPATPTSVSKPSQKPAPKSLEIDTLPDMQPMAPLNHIGKDRPKRLKTNKPRRPVTKQNDVINDNDNLVADEGMDMFFNTPVVKQTVETPSTKDTAPKKKETPSDKPSKPESEKSVESKKKKLPFQTSKDNDQKKEKEKEKDKEKEKKGGALANFFSRGKKKDEKNSTSESLKTGQSPERGSKNRKSPERGSKTGKSPDRDVKTEKSPESSVKTELPPEPVSKPVKREESVKSQKGSEEETKQPATPNDTPKEEKTEDKPEAEVKKPGPPKIALMPKKAGFGGNILAEMKVKQENRASKMLLDEKITTPEDEKKKIKEKTETVDTKVEKKGTVETKVEKKGMVETKVEKKGIVETKVEKKGIVETKVEKKSTVETKVEKKEDMDKADDKNKDKKDNDDVKEDKKEEKVATENNEDANDSPLRPPRPKSQASKPAEDTDSHRHSILKMVQQQSPTAQSPAMAAKPKPAPRSSGTGQRTPSQSSIESTTESQNHNRTSGGDGKPKPPPVKPRPPVAQKPNRSSFNKNTDVDDVQAHDTPAADVKENGNDKSEVVVDSATLRLNVKEKIKKLSGDINMNSEQVPPLGFRKKNASLPRDKTTASDVDDRTSRPQSMFVGLPSNSDIGPISNKLSKTKSDVNIATSSDDNKNSENKDEGESKADSSVKDPAEKEEETTKEDQENKENSGMDLKKEEEIIMV